MTRVSHSHASAEQLAQLERLLSLCEVQSVRSGVPLPLEAHLGGDGVNSHDARREAATISQAGYPVQSYSGTILVAR